MPHRIKGSRSTPCFTNSGQNLTRLIKLIKTAWSCMDCTPPALDWQIWILEVKFWPLTPPALYASSSWGFNMKTFPSLPTKTTRPWNLWIGFPLQTQEQLASQIVAKILSSTGKSQTITVQCNTVQLVPGDVIFINLSDKLVWRIWTQWNHLQRTSTRRKLGQEVKLWNRVNSPGLTLQTYESAQLKVRRSLLIISSSQGPDQISCQKRKGDTNLPVARSDSQERISTHSFAFHDYILYYQYCAVWVFRSLLQYQKRHEKYGDRQPHFSCLLLSVSTPCLKVSWLLCCAFLKLEKVTSCCLANCLPLDTSPALLKFQSSTMLFVIMTMPTTNNLHRFLGNPPTVPLFLSNSLAIQNQAALVTSSQASLLQVAHYALPALMLWCFEHKHETHDPSISIGNWRAVLRIRVLGVAAHNRGKQ